MLLLASLLTSGTVYTVLRSGKPLGILQQKYAQTTKVDSFLIALNGYLTLHVVGVKS